MTKPTPLQHGKYYHIYNRGNNRENIFNQPRNYHYFLKLYASHLSALALTYAYCLLKNHFHFLVRILTVEEIRQHLARPDRAPPDNLQDLPLKLRNPSQSFSNLFNAYARSFNRAYDRTGALFQRPFGRVEVTSNAHFTRLITYIHQNPHKHGFVNDFRDWPYSSYHALLSTEKTRLQREDVLGWFGGVDHFQEVHRFGVDEGLIAALAPEDFD